MDEAEETKQFNVTDGSEITGFDARSEHPCDSHSFEQPVACKVRNTNTHLRKEKCCAAAFEQRYLLYTSEPLVLNGSDIGIPNSASHQLFTIYSVRSRGKK